MVRKTRPEYLKLVEVEARKVPPLRFVVFLFAAAMSPFLISALVAVLAEYSSLSLPDDFYGTLRWASVGGFVVSSIPVSVLAKRKMKRQVELAEQMGELSGFQLGWGAVRSVWKDWWSFTAAVLLTMYLIAQRDIDRYLFGVNYSELSEAQSYWHSLELAGVVVAFFFCFLGFCIWLGRRVQKQRAAR